MNKGEKRTMNKGEKKAKKKRGGRQGKSGTLIQEMRKEWQVGTEYHFFPGTKANGRKTKNTEKGSTSTRIHRNMMEIGNTAKRKDLVSFSFLMAKDMKVLFFGFFKFSIPTITLFPFYFFFFLRLMYRYV